MGTMMLGSCATLAAGLMTCAPSASVGADAVPISQAAAILHDAQGHEVGHATVSTAKDGLDVVLAVSGLPAGTHGAHIHTTGTCDAPDFASAGGHWNPTGTHHGSMNPQGPHEGDLPNLMVGTDGKASLRFTLAGATMAGLLDADGAAIVIHAGPDDLKTDPAGNSGARIACGVFSAA